MSVSQPIPRVFDQSPDLEKQRTARHTLHTERKCPNGTYNTIDIQARQAPKIVWGIFPDVIIKTEERDDHSIKRPRMALALRPLEDQRTMMRAH